MRVLGISGSLRTDSLNTRLLRLAAEELGEGATLDLYDGLADVPPYDTDVEDDLPAAVARLRDAIEAADAVLVASPEYNGSVPGQLKNAIDWVSRPAAGTPLRGKPVAAIGASPGRFGGVWAQAELRKVLGVVGARIVPTELAVAKAHERLEEPDDELRAQLRALLAELAELSPAGALDRVAA